MKLFTPDKFTLRYTALLLVLFVALSATATIPCGLTLTLTGSASSCAGRDTLTLSGASTSSRIVWQSAVSSVTVDSAGGTIDTIFVPGIGGVYTAIVTDPGGCLDTSSSVVIDSTFTPTVSISINTHDTICRNDQVTFFAVGTNGGSNPDYQWKANGVNIGNSPTYIGTNILNGDVYSCVFTSTALCVTQTHVTSDSITFTVHAYPSVTISSTSPCSGGSVALTASGGLSYRWSTGDSIPSIRAATGYYAVTATGNYGCTASAFHDVTVHTPLRDSIVQSNDTLLLLSSGTGEFYQWYLNDSIISSATGTSYIATQSGSYRVSVIDSSGCLSSSGLSRFGETGINIINASPSIRIYPNPSMGRFTLECTDATPQLVSIKDAQGRLIMGNVTIAGQHQFDLSSLTEGIYYLHISDGKTTQALKFSVVK